MSHFNDKLHIYNGDAFSFRIAVTVPDEVLPENVTPKYVFEGTELDTTVVDKVDDAIRVDVQFVEATTAELEPGYYEGQLFFTVDGNTQVVHDTEVEIDKRQEVSA